MYEIYIIPHLWGIDGGGRVQAGGNPIGQHCGVIQERVLTVTQGEEDQAYL